MKSLFSINLLLILCLIPLVSLQAETGRLPNGKAFRTDSEGNQIVDYVAELEFEIASLKRRVNGLEFEVEEKNKVIKRVGSTGTIDAPLAEKDLLTGKVKTIQPKFVETAKKIEYTEDKVLNCDAEFSGFKKENSQLDRKVKSLESELVAAKQQLSKVESTRASYDSDSDSRFKLIKINHKEKVDDLRAEHAVSLSAHNKKIENLERLLRQKDEEIRNLDLDIQRTALQKQEAAKAPPYAKNTVRRTVTPVRSNVNNSALNSLKGSVKKNIVSLKRVLSKRDSLFKSYKKKNGGALSIVPKKSISSKGRSITKIEKLLDRAKSISEVTALQRDVREISTNIEADLSFIKRMTQIM